jgi:hypothetical protein
MKRLWNVLILNFYHPKGWIFAVRLLVLAFMLACIGWFIAGLFDFPQYAASHLVEFIPYTPYWNPETFSQIMAPLGLTLSIWLNFTLATSILSALVFWGVGLVIFARRPDEWFGMYTGASFVLFGTVLGAPATVFVGLHPELYWVLNPLGTLAWWALFTQLFLFPNGRFVPYWTRWVALLLLLVYLAILVFYPQGTPPAPLVLAVLGLFGTGAISQVHRYRRVSTPVERQQRW